jgi:hypothetical protein
LILAHPPPSEPTFSRTNLRTLADLHALISSCTSIPLPKLHALDTGLSVVPYHYLLLSYPSGLTTLAKARHDGALTEQDGVRVDLQLGVYLRQLHDIQNDWFGIPLPNNTQPIDPSYAWGESFTLLLEEALHKAETEVKMDFDFQELRGYLSRAIGFYLFDDVEVPSLVWFSGSEDDVLVSLPSPPSTSEVQIKVFSLTFTQAIWGDPLLESFFFPSGPSETIQEGYEKQLIVFARQRTKRLWYNVFLALMGVIHGGQEKRDWARQALEEYTLGLRDAPCY